MHDIKWIRENASAFDAGLKYEQVEERGFISNLAARDLGATRQAVRQVQGF